MQEYSFIYYWCFPGKCKKKETKKKKKKKNNKKKKNIIQILGRGLFKKEISSSSALLSNKSQFLTSFGNNKICLHVEQTDELTKLWFTTQQIPHYS